MKLETGNLEGPALEWAVAVCEGRKPQVAIALVKSGSLSYSTNFDAGGPIIEREEIHTFTQYPRAPNFPKVWYGRFKGRVLGQGPTWLIAGLRCFVAAKLGETVEVPDELISGKT